jgi:hypothetical protein
MATPDMNTTRACVHDDTLSLESAMGGWQAFMLPNDQISWLAHQSSINHVAA